jgi:glycosyltransferase involved in cell wall biosynthesis
MENTSFSGRIGIIQRVLPAYRAEFFDRLSSFCPGGVEVFAGTPLSGEGIHVVSRLDRARLRPAENRHIGRGRAYFCWQSGAAAWLGEWRPDVLVLEANPRLLSNRSAIRAMRAEAKPVIGWGLGVLDWGGAGWLQGFRRSHLEACFARFDALIAYSRKGARDYESLGVPPERIFLAPNAVSQESAERMRERIEKPPDLLSRWKKDRGLSNSPAVLFVGRLTGQKRVGDLLRACAAVSVPCELLIVGDGPERSRLEAEAREVFPGARFLGHQTGEELACCFAAADLFVLPGQGGLAVQEAMAFGKAIVAGEGDGSMDDLVREGENGFQVKPGDIGALAGAIERCVGDISALERMGAESRRIVEDEINLGAMVRAFVHALNRVCGELG